MLILITEAIETDAFNWDFNSFILTKLQSLKLDCWLKIDQSLHCKIIITKSMQRLKKMSLCWAFETRAFWNAQLQTIAWMTLSFKISFFNKRSAQSEVFKRLDSALKKFYVDAQL